MLITAVKILVIRIMDYAQGLTLQVVVSLVLTNLGTAVSLAAATPEAQVQACINTAVLKLNGTPRATITATPGTANPDGTRQVKWSTRSGGAGTCLVDPTNRVTQFHAEVDPSLRLGENSQRLVAVAGKAVIVTTSGDPLNIRSSPAGAITGSTANGSTLILTGKISGEWLEVQGGGWVSQYLVSEVASPNPISGATGQPAASASSSPNSPSQPASGNHKQAIVATDGGGLNIRNNPNGEITASLTDGSTVTLTGQRSGEWVEIQGGGWVSEGFLKYQ